jgi:hypothetical protein
MEQPLLLRFPSIGRAQGGKEACLNLTCRSAGSFFTWAATAKTTTPKLKSAQYDQIFIEQCDWVLFELIAGRSYSSAAFKVDEARVQKRVE